MAIIGIYKITCIKTKKVYIGQSVNIHKRWNEHKRRYSKKISKLYNSITKYGVENHTFEIVTTCKIDQLNELERYYQEVYNSVDRKTGLNLVYVEASGKRREFTQEVKDSISKKVKELGLQKGEKNGMYGKKHSEETKAMWRQKRKGQNKGGKNHSAVKAIVTNLDTLEVYTGCMQELKHILNCDVELIWYRLIGKTKTPTKLKEFDFKYEEKLSVDDIERYLNLNTGIYYHYKSEIFDYCEKYLGYNHNVVNRHLKGECIKKDIPFIII